MECWPLLSVLWLRFWLTAIFGINGCGQKGTYCGITTFRLNFNIWNFKASVFQVQRSRKQELKLRYVAILLVFLLSDTKSNVVYLVFYSVWLVERCQTDSGSFFNTGGRLRACLFDFTAQGTSIHYIRVSVAQLNRSQRYRGLVSVYDQLTNAASTGQNYYFKKKESNQMA